MNPPKIIKLSIFHLPMISQDMFEIMVKPIDFDVARHKIIVQVLLKSYTLERNTLKVKLPITTTVNNHPLQSQLKGNDSLRVKAFIYDMVTEKVIEAKLQEFGMPTPEQSIMPSSIARTTAQEPLTFLEYKPNDYLLPTVPVILGWEKPKVVGKPRQIAKLEVNQSKSIDSLKKEFNVDVLLTDFSLVNIKLYQTVELLVDNSITIATYYPKQSAKMNKLFAKVTVTFSNILNTSQTFELTVRVMDNPILETPIVVSSKTIKVIVMSDGTVSEFVDKSPINQKCYCNRNFTVEEYKSIIISLRKKNGYKKLSDVLFDKKKTEKLNDVTFDSFTTAINTIFSKYEVNNCIQKIHFIAQTYHETIHYRATYEGLKLDQVPKNYKGGYDFQGRGVKQITHDYNYLAYYDKVNSTSYFKDKYMKDRLPIKKGKIEGVSEFVKRINDSTFGEDFLDELKEFAKKLANEIDFAFDSAGWFWDSNKLNPLAAEDDILKVSNKINGSINGIPNGYEERKKYTNDLKEIMKYEKCINNT